VTGVAALIARDVRRAYAGGGVTMLLGFFLLAATLFPFAVGPDTALLARIGGGVIWAATLLAALLPVERLVAPDLEAGVLDQLAVRGQSLAAVAAAKLLAHWIAFGPPVMVAAVIAGGLLDLPGATLLRVEAGLAIGTPGLAALAVATAALTASRGGSAVAGLVMLPLAVPLLIFGAGAIAPSAGNGAGAFKLLAAVSLLLVAGAPFVAGAAMRAAMD
jgi:heme exporter protein B